MSSGLGLPRQRQNTYAWTVIERTFSIWLRANRRQSHSAIPLAIMS
jgi:hypothetical protein